MDGLQQFREKWGHPLNGMIRINIMRKYILFTLALVLIVTIGFGTKVDAETKEDYFNRGSAYYVNGQYDKAIADLSKAIELNPKDAKAYYNRGLAYGKGKGQFDKAIADFTKAIELDPTDANAYIGRGVAWGKKGVYDRAISDCNKAVELNPTNATAYNNRGINWKKKVNTTRLFRIITKPLN